MKFLADENFDNRIVRGLLRRNPNLDIVRAQDLEIAGADDPTVLVWAAEAGRILLTHDERTIPHYAYERLAIGQSIAGVIVASDNLPISTVI
jgi:predicted nuclease of predicted toxin-antitoxin system